MNVDDYKSCPVGIANKKEIEKVEDKFAMAIERIEEKLDDMNKKMDKGFLNVSDSIKKVENRFDNFEAKLPEKIDERIRQNTSNKIINAVKWVLITLCGSVAITVITKLIIQALHLS